MSSAELSPSAAFVWHYCQEPLAKAQRVPIIGIIPSALKAVISSVQAVVGSIFAMFLGAISYPCFACDNEEVGNSIFVYADSASMHASMGFFGLSFSLLNILSFTSLAYTCPDVEL